MTMAGLWGLLIHCPLHVSHEKVLSGKPICGGVNIVDTLHYSVLRLRVIPSMSDKKWQRNEPRRHRRTNCTRS